MVRTERRVRRKEDIGEKRTRLPAVDRAPLEPPPIVVAIVGPPKVGKSTLLHCLIRNFTRLVFTHYSKTRMIAKQKKISPFRQTISNIQGPVTIVSGKKRRITFIECSNDINMMVDVAKIADLVRMPVVFWP